MKTLKDRNYYLVRSCRNIKPEDNVVGIGWDDIRFCDHTDAESIINEITNIRKWKIGRRSNIIRRFKSIQEGDIIVVPYWGTIFIGIATGEPIYDEKYRGQNGCNQQRVVFFRDTNNKVIQIPRSELEERLQKRLKVKQTVTDLIEFKTELDSIIERLESHQSYTWEDQFNEQENTREKGIKEQLLRNIRDGKTRLPSGGIGLEEVIKELLIIDNFEDVRILSKKTFKGQADADIRASKSHVIRSTQDDFLVQVKHHTGNTGNWGLKQLEWIAEQMPDEYKDYNLTLITSGDVGGDIIEEAEGKNITVIDGDGLAEWIYNSIPKLTPKTKMRLGISNTPYLL